MEDQNIEYKEIKFIAIIHRDQTGAHIQMKVYNDRIELWNDGGLPEGYTIDTLLRKHNSKPRNKNLAEIFGSITFLMGFDPQSHKSLCRTPSLPEPRRNA